MQTSRNLTIRLGGSVCLICHSVWYRCEDIMIGRIVIKCNCITVRIGKCLCDVCQIVFGVKQKDVSSLLLSTLLQRTPLWSLQQNRNVQNLMQVKVL